MGAVDELLTDQRGFCPENLRINAFQLFPAHIVVAVASGACKIPVGDPVVLERGKPPLGVLLGDGVDAGKLLRQLPLGLVPQRLYLW